MTLFEVLLVIAIVVVLGALLLPGYGPRRHYPALRISCVNNLKQVGIAFQIWGGDNNDKYPMAVSVTNGGAMELIAAGNVAACFQTMSNELSTPKILFCPADATRTSATNFAFGFNERNVSYFVGADAVETNATMFLAGDDNFEISSVPVKSGVQEIFTNTPITWSAARHKFAGNIGLADGSVQQVTQSGLQSLLEQTGTVTNRLVIP